MVDKSGGYNLPKALCIRGKAHKVTEYEGCCRIKPNKGPGGPQWIWCEYRYSTRRRKNARRSGYRNNWLTKNSNAKELWFPNRGIRSRGSDQRQVSWIDIDRQSIKVWFVEHQLMSGVTSEPKGRILIVIDDCEHSQTYRIKCSKLRWQRMLMSIARHMEVTIMQADKEEQE